MPDLSHHGPVRLTRARVPACLAEGLGTPDAEGFVRCDLAIANGRIGGEGGVAVDLGGAIVLPGLVDCHTHLDKGQIWGRAPNPDGTFPAALATVRADRSARWTADDVRARMEFVLASAWAHGTVAIRTHIDTGDHRTRSSWETFAAVRAEWAGRIVLQGAALTTLDEVFSPAYAETADLVAAHGGILGAVTYPMEDLDRRLDRVLGLATERGMDVDFHTDETIDPTSATLRQIAAAVMRNRFPGRVLCGHCCSLSVQTEAEAAETIRMVAEAGIDVVSLPMCNMYLQDRAPGRTPRLRGVTLVHELRAAGVWVAFASDNTRDPFHAYGDLDMIEVMRESVRIAHLDHPMGDWPAAFASVPAAIMGVDAGVIRPGAPADLIVTEARSWTELFARPQTGRTVIRAGRAIAAAPAPYSRLDSLMETP